MNFNTQQNTMQDPIALRFEQAAAEIVNKYQAQLRELTKAHRRERYIGWYEYYDDSGEAWDVVTADYVSRGCEPPVSVSSEEENEIIGRHFDSLTENEILAFEKQLRLGKFPDWYWDNFYDDDLIDLRNEWCNEIHKLGRELIDRPRESLQKQYQSLLEDDSDERHLIKEELHKFSALSAAFSAIRKIDDLKSPSIFNCNSCNCHSHTHDELGNVIAAIIGLTSVEYGTYTYLICESCAINPEPTLEALNKLLTESEEYEREREKECALEHIEWMKDQNGMSFAEVADLLSDAYDDWLNTQQASAQANQTSNTASGNTGSQSQPGSSYNPRFVFHPYDQFIQRPSKPWKIENIIGDRDIAIIFGEAGSGKTYAVIDLIFSACLGRDWVGQYDIVQGGWKGKFKVTRPLTVAYAFGEGGAGLPDRLKAAERYYNAGQPLTNLFFIEDVPQLYRYNDPSGILSFIGDYSIAQNAGQIPPLDILIIDTQATATLGADENSSTHMAEVLAHAKTIISSLGCSVILIHHETKNGGTYRGSSVLHGAADCMIRITKNDSSGKRAMECFKLKDGQPWDEQGFTIVSHSAGSAYVSWDSPTAKGSGGSAPTNEDKIMKVLMDNPGRQFTAKNINERTGIAESTARNLLGRLTANGQVVYKPIQKGNSEVAAWAFDLTT